MTKLKLVRSKKDRFALRVHRAEGWPPSTVIALGMTDLSPPHPHINLLRNALTQRCRGLHRHITSESYNRDFSVRDSGLSNCIR